jgi:hypothetical protein
MVFSIRPANRSGNLEYPSKIHTGRQGLWPRAATTAHPVTKKTGIGGIYVLEAQPFLV